jgi:hypothetical protein
MIRKPESRGFLGKAGFEKGNPAERLGFFVKGKKGPARGLMKFFPSTSLIY